MDLPVIAAGSLHNNLESQKGKIMPEITVKVDAREFIPGQKKVYNWKEELVLVTTVQSKLSMFRTCLKEFGRCTGVISLGWTFEGRLVADDGSVSWFETKVTIISGATPVPGFILK